MTSPPGIARTAIAARIDCLRCWPALLSAPILLPELWGKIRPDSSAGPAAAISAHEMQVRKTSFPVVALALAGAPALGQTLGDTVSNVSKRIYSLINAAIVGAVVVAVAVVVVVAIKRKLRKPD